MPILDIQERFRELGRLRTGVLEKPENGRPRPRKLARYRLTTKWRHLLDDAAAVYGGTVKAWEHPQEGAQWELFVEADAINVVIPPGEILSQWYELWSGGGCQRRCDGVRQVLVDAPCACPSDPNERRELAGANPPKACKPTTRLSVMIPDVSDLGIWRLETHGYNAAVELGGAAALCELATRRGVMIPGTLRLEARSSRKPGEAVKRFAVPVLSFRGNLGDTLEALGMTRPDGIPVAGPIEPRPALDAGGIPELPAAPAPFAPAPELERASIPEAEVPEPEAFIPPEREPDERDDGAALEWSQMFAMRCRDVPAVGNDVARHGLVIAITGGRAHSSKELERSERALAMDLLVRLARGTAKLEQPQPGFWVFTDEAGSLLSGQDPRLEPTEESAPSEPQQAAQETPAPRPAHSTDDDVIDVSEAPSAAPTMPETPDDWRRFLAERRLKIGDAVKAAAQVRPNAKPEELPGNLGALVKDPELAADVYRRLSS